MVFDGFIFLVAIAMAVAGWNVGIINSWRGPLAVIAATVVTQMFYVDFATWIVQQLRVEPAMAVGLGYVLLWVLIEIVVEILLNVLVPLGTKKRPQLFERIFGAALGLVKTLVICILPLMALNVEITVPKAPPEKSPMIIPMPSGIDQASFFKMLTPVARGLIPGLGSFVVSTKPPSFQPNFKNTTQLGPASTSLQDALKK